MGLSSGVTIPKLSDSLQWLLPTIRFRDWCSATTALFGWPGQFAAGDGCEGSKDFQRSGSKMAKLIHQRYDKFLNGD